MSDSVLDFVNNKLDIEWIKENPKLTVKLIQGLLDLRKNDKDYIKSLERKINSFEIECERVKELNMLAHAMLINNE